MLLWHGALATPQLSHQRPFGRQATQPCPRSPAVPMGIERNWMAHVTPGRRQETPVPAGLYYPTHLGPPRSFVKVSRRTSKMRVNAATPTVGARSYRSRRALRGLAGGLRFRQGRSIGRLQKTRPAPALRDRPQFHDDPALWRQPRNVLVPDDPSGPHLLLIFGEVVSPLQLWRQMVDAAVRDCVRHPEIADARRE